MRSGDCLANAKAKVKGPNFPISMFKMITHLPNNVKLPVNPMDSPKVPNADTLSNIIIKNDASSVRFKRNIVVKTTPILPIVKANAFKTTWLGILLW